MAKRRVGGANGMRRAFAAVTFRRVLGLTNG